MAYGASLPSQGFYKTFLAHRPLLNTKSQRFLDRAHMISPLLLFRASILLYLCIRSFALLQYMFNYMIESRLIEGLPNVCRAF